MRVHTIPVPPGWTPEQAWEVIQRGEKIPEDDEPSWVNVETDDQDNFIRLLPKTNWHLVLPFDTDDDDFIRGVEVGRIFEQLKHELGEVRTTVHSTNAEMMLRIATATDRELQCNIIDDTWIEVIFT